MKAWFKFLSWLKLRPQRELPRLKTNPSLTCSIRQNQTKQELNVQLCDLSTSGLGFFTKNSCFEIGERVAAIFNLNEMQLKINGTVVSQHIYYPNNLENLKSAVYRFSLVFEKELDSKRLQQFTEISN